MQHLALQKEHYASEGPAATFCMRKQLIWYAAGWPGARALREKINTLSHLGEAETIVTEFALLLKSQGVLSRKVAINLSAAPRFKE